MGGESVLFFDTETTGLKGVGTHIFLLGFLEVAEESFILTQYIMADPAHEAASCLNPSFGKVGYRDYL